MDICLGSLVVILLRLGNFAHCFGIGSGLTIPNELLVVCAGKDLFTFSHLLNLMFNCLFGWGLILSVGLLIETMQVHRPNRFWSCFGGNFFVCNISFVSFFLTLVAVGVVVTVVL